MNDIRAIDLQVDCLNAQMNIIKESIRKLKSARNRKIYNIAAAIVGSNDWILIADTTIQIENELTEEQNKRRKEETDRKKAIQLVSCPKRKALTSKQIDSSNEDVCGICLELHTARESLETECKHRFGATCFEHWTNACVQQRKALTCPCCKKVNPKVVQFYERAKPKRKLKTNDTTESLSAPSSIVVENN